MASANYVRILIYNIQFPAAWAWPWRIYGLKKKITENQAIREETRFDCVRAREKDPMYVTDAHTLLINAVLSCCQSECGAYVYTRTYVRSCSNFNNSKHQRLDHVQVGFSRQLFPDQPPPQPLSLFQYFEVPPSPVSRADVSLLLNGCASLATSEDGVSSTAFAFPGGSSRGASSPAAICMLSRQATRSVGDAGACQRHDQSASSESRRRFLSIGMG